MRAPLWFVRWRVRHESDEAGREMLDLRVAFWRLLYYAEASPDEFLAGVMKRINGGANERDEVRYFASILWRPRCRYRQHGTAFSKTDCVFPDEHDGAHFATIGNRQLRWLRSSAPRAPYLFQTAIVKMTRHDISILWLPKQEWGQEDAPGPLWMTPRMRTNTLATREPEEKRS